MIRPSTVTAAAAISGASGNSIPHSVARRDMTSPATPERASWAAEI